MSGLELIGKEERVQALLKRSMKLCLMYNNGRISCITELYIAQECFCCG
jgi:hypothetical protein